MRLGRYELTDVLGEGGMATVFEATDTKLNRQVAVKVMFPHLARRDEAVARFKREARAAAGLDHEHILRVFDVGGGGVEDGHLVPPYIVLELVDGESLNEVFQGKEPPLAEVVAAIGVALCRALSQAHEQGIVHRDIKPANVMVTKAGRLALADFGVAHMGEEDSLVTKTGTILGTPAFMSPEQAMSDPVDSRSDIYSLGATLYTIATGSLPYSGSSAHILASILGGNCRSIEEVNPLMGRELSRIIQSMMKTDPEERISSAEKAAEALLQVVTGGGFEDVDELLLDFFTGPESQAEVRRQSAMSATLVRALRMADEGRMPMALSLADRVLSLDSENLQAQTLARKFGKQRRQRLWPAVALPMIVTAAAGLLFWGSRPGSIAEYVYDAGAPVAVTGPSDATAIELMPTIVGGPDDAGAEPDAKARVVRPRNDKDARVRPPALTMKVADAGVVAVKPDAKVAVPVAPKEPARLIVDIKPWCVVHIDGKRHDRASPTRVITLAEGSHKIECKQDATGLSWSKNVTLRAGEQRTLKGTVLADVTVKVRLSNAQSVKIAGRTVPNGSRVTLPAARHRVEIIRDGKASGKPVYIDVRRNCTLRDKGKLTCSAD
jgi:serine/threonine-protein kinase